LAFPLHIIETPKRLLSILDKVHRLLALVGGGADAGRTQGPVTGASLHASNLSTVLLSAASLEHSSNAFGSKSFDPPVRALRAPRELVLSSDRQAL